MISYREFELQCLRTKDQNLSKHDCILNWTLGLVGEVNEIFEIVLNFEYKENIIMNLVKEIGDTLWYLTMFNYELGFAPESEQVLNPNYYNDYNFRINYMASLQINVGKIAELIKHYTMHRENINFLDLLNLTKETLENLFYLSKQYRIPLHLCAELNVQKLNHRFSLNNEVSFKEVNQVDRRLKDNDFKETKIYKDLKTKILKTK